MFSKPFAKAGSRTVGPMAGEASIASALKRAAPQQCSLLASDLRLEGDVVGDGELLVEGQITGDVRVSRLIVNKQAEIVGRIEADSVDVRGRVIGDIAAKVVRLLETAHVDGDILHEQLSIEGGAFYRGRVERRDPSGLALPEDPHTVVVDAQGGAAVPNSDPAALEPLSLERFRPATGRPDLAVRNPHTGPAPTRAAELAAIDHSEERSGGSGASEDAMAPAPLPPPAQWPQLEL